MAAWLKGHSATLAPPMRVHLALPFLPRHPLLRLLVLIGAAIALVGLVTLGFVVGAVVLTVAALVLTVRRWLAHRAARADPSIIEGEFTVVPRHRIGTPRAE